MPVSFAVFFDRGHAAVVVPVIFVDLALAGRAGDAGGKHVRRDDVPAAVVAQVEHHVGNVPVLEFLDGREQFVVIGRVETVVDQVADPMRTGGDHFAVDYRIGVYFACRERYGLRALLVFGELDRACASRGY